MSKKICWENNKNIYLKNSWNCLQLFWWFDLFWSKLTFLLLIRRDATATTSPTQRQRRHRRNDDDFSCSRFVVKQKPWSTFFRIFRREMRRTKKVAETSIKTSHKNMTFLWCWYRRSYNMLLSRCLSWRSNIVFTTEMAEKVSRRFLTFPLFVFIFIIIQLRCQTESLPLEKRKIDTRADLKVSIYYFLRRSC